MQKKNFILINDTFMLQDASLHNLMEIIFKYVRKRKIELNQLKYL